MNWWQNRQLGPRGGTVTVLSGTGTGNRYRYTSAKKESAFGSKQHTINALAGHGGLDGRTHSGQRTSSTHATTQLLPQYSMMTNMPVLTPS